MSSSPTNERPTVTRTRRRLRRAVVGVAASACLAAAGVVATSESASAADVTMSSGQSAYFPTWFFGRTTICFDNTKGPNWQYFYVENATYFTAFYVGAHSQYCLTRSWVGLSVEVGDSVVSPGGIPVRVYEPYGPL